MDKLIVANMVNSSKPLFLLVPLSRFELERGDPRRILSPKQRKIKGFKCLIYFITIYTKTVQVIEITLYLFGVSTYTAPQ